jgi:hypothetical protein
MGSNRPMLCYRRPGPCQRRADVGRSHRARGWRGGVASDDVSVAPTRRGGRRSKRETQGVCQAWWLPENLTREDGQRRGGGRTTMFQLRRRLRRSIAVLARSCDTKGQRGVREWPPNGGRTSTGGAHSRRGRMVVETLISSALMALRW